MNTKKILTLLLAIVLVVTVAITAVACTNTSLSDKLDSILGQLSELRKEMERQQTAIAELVGAGNIDVLIINPDTKLKDYVTAPKQSIEGKSTKFTIKHTDVANFVGDSTVHQDDVLNYLVSINKISCITSPAVGVEEIKLIESGLTLEAKSGNYIFNFTTVPKFCPPTPSMWDYSFALGNFEVFSSYNTISDTVVTAGSVMGFGYVVTNW